MSDESGFPRVEITAEMEDEARRTAKGISSLRNSIRHGEGAYMARLGELAVAHYIGGEVVDTYDYDVLSPKGKRIEVKSVETTVVPLPDYRVHLCKHNTSQRCDFYMFVRVQVGEHRPPIAWLVGYMAAGEFRERAVFRARGEVEPDTGWIVKEDSYSMLISELNPMPAEMVQREPEWPVRPDLTDEQDYRKCRELLRSVDVPNGVLVTAFDPPRRATLVDAKMRVKGFPPGVRVILEGEREIVRRSRTKNNPTGTPVSRNFESEDVERIV